MPLVVSQQPIAVKYWAPLGSVAALLKILFIFTNIIFAFLIGFATQDFWLREVKVTEQPLVDFTKDAVFHLYDDEARQTFSYSSITNTSGLLSNLRVPSISIERHDTNFDGYPDMIEYTATFPVGDSERVTYVQAMLGTSLALRARTRFMMDSAVLLTLAAPGRNAQGVTVNGEISLRQLQRLPHRGLTNLAWTYGPLLSGHGAYTVEQLSLDSFQQQLTSRNVTTEISNSREAWQMRTAASTGSFVVKLRLRVPDQDIRLEPEMMTVIKFSWVQFFCIFSVLFLLSRAFLNFLVQSRVLPTRMEWPSSIAKAHMD